MCSIFQQKESYAHIQQVKLENKTPFKKAYELPVLTTTNSNV